MLRSFSSSIRLAGAFLVFTACALASAPAAEAISVSIDKPHVDITSSPGSVSDGEIKLKNKGTDPVAVSVSVEDWTYDAEGKREFKAPGTTPFSCARWLEINPMSAVVGAGEEKTFGYILKVPQGTTGGHYAVVFFECGGAAATQDAEGMNVKIVGRIGSVIYHEIEGRVNKIGVVEDIAVAKPAENEPLILTYKFKNSGNAFIKFKGIMNITDASGNVYGKAESSKEMGTLPGDVREDSIKWFGSLKKGGYDIILTIDGGETMVPVVSQTKLVMEKDVP